MDREEENFRKLRGFPGVVGAIDGTHIPIKSPAAVQKDYLNNQ